MGIRTGKLKILGTRVSGDNPLPIFRDIEKDKPSRSNGTLLPEEEKFLGENTGFRVLPYKMLDKYDRKKHEIELETVVLENNKLTAVFLPGQGGRLWSLKNKKTGKEILYTNPVFQPANLGIRNAWFSGGVEWNCAQYGHVVYSSSPVFFARVRAADGEEFLRMYEFERMKRLFIQLDFHLPENAEALYVKVSVYNLDEEEKSMYWWTNIAIQATKGLRVFSGTQDVIYLDPDSISDNTNPIRIFGRTKLPYLPTLPGKDSSYPANATYSNEFFFQNPENTQNCWSAAVYENGRIFYEASTLPLRFRKMFCWGSHEGGQRWCEYLANKEDGNYVELQAGLAPTQLNSIYLPGKTTWSFTQAIGETGAADIAAAYDGDYDEAQKFVNRAVRLAMPTDQLEAYDREYEEKAKLPVTEILAYGAGWGALEEKRGCPVPGSMKFPEDTIGEEQLPWLSLIEKGYLPETDTMVAPVSWMVDPQYMLLLKNSLKMDGGDHYLSRLHLGVMLFELGHRSEGVEQWEKSLSMRRSPFALRNLAYAAKLDGKMEQAINLMEQAVREEHFSIDRDFSEEFMDMLLQTGQFERAWEFYEGLPREFQEQDHLYMQAAAAAVELDHPKWDFIEALFTRDVACIREGDNMLTDLYSRYHVRKLLLSEDHAMSQEEAEEYVAKHCIPPRFIDFRMVVKG